MKRPVNFETIDAVDFEIHGHNFHTDLDLLQNKEKNSIHNCLFEKFKEVI